MPSELDGKITREPAGIFHQDDADALQAAVLEQLNEAWLGIDGICA